MRLAELRDYFEEDHLSDGSPVIVRAIRPEDREALQEGLQHQSPESIYHRFFRQKQELTHEELDYFTKLDFLRHVGIGALVPVEGELLPVAVARYVVADENEPLSAEIAFAVDDPHQGRGIGTVLLKHLVAIARDAGLLQFTANVLCENTKMLHVFEHSGLPMSSVADEGIMEVTLSLV